MIADELSLEADAAERQPAHVAARFQREQRGELVGVIGELDEACRPSRRRCARASAGGRTWCRAARARRCRRLAASRSTSISRRASNRTSAICANRSTSASASASASSAASRSGATLSAWARVASVRGGIRREEDHRPRDAAATAKLAVGDATKSITPRHARATLTHRRCDSVRAPPICLTLPSRAGSFRCDADSHAAARVAL